MTRNERIVKAINDLEIRHNRFLNDTWIFVEDARPSLERKANELRRDTSQSRKKFDVPRDGRDATARRTKKQIGDIYLAQFERGVFESNIIEWPAAGSKDTRLGVFMEPEVDHGATEVHAGVQA